MHWRGLAVPRGVAHVDDGDELVPIDTGQQRLQQGGVEGTDPKRSKALILRGQHEVGGDDGGIDFRPILPVVPPHPRLVRTASDGQEKGRTIVGTGGVFDGLQHIRGGDCPYMDGLLIDGRRRDPPGLEDALDGLPLNGSRGEGAAGVATVEEGGEVHGDEYI